MDVTALVKAMRQRADWLEKHADLFVQCNSIYSKLHIHASTMSKVDQQAILRALGSWDKQRSDSILWCVQRQVLTKETYCETTVFLDSNAFCKRVTRTVKLPARPARPALLEREESITEWECPDALLAPAVESPVIRSDKTGGPLPFIHSEITMNR